MRYLETAVAEFNRYKTLAEKSFSQLSDTDLHWLPNKENNSVAVIIKHVSGNMVSRWTDFLTTDGEKPGRDRTAEFTDDSTSRQVLMSLWERGWKCLFDAIAHLSEDDLMKTVTIRGAPHSVVQAINRQMAHYAYHVGQIVYIAKQLRAQDWKPSKGK